MTDGNAERYHRTQFESMVRLDGESVYQFFNRLQHRRARLQTLNFAVSWFDFLRRFMSGVHNPDFVRL